MYLELTMTMSPAMYAAFSDELEKIAAQEKDAGFMDTMKTVGAKVAPAARSLNYHANSIASHALAGMGGSSLHQEGPISLVAKGALGHFQNMARTGNKANMAMTAGSAFIPT